MSRSARNFRLVSIVTAAMLSGAAGGYLYSRWEVNNKKSAELEKAYAETKTLSERNDGSASPRSAEVSKEIAGKGGPALNITFRAIGHDNVSATANGETAFEVLNGIKSSEYFDTSQTRVDGGISAEVPPGTFSFKITTKLKRPLTL